MKKTSYITVAGIALLTSQLANAQAFKGTREVRETKAPETREVREERLRIQTQNRQSGIQSEGLNQKISFLSAQTRGQTDANQLKVGLQREYMVQIVDAKSNSSRAVTVKMNDLFETVSKESVKIKEINESNLVGESHSVFTARKQLVDLSAKMIAVASKKYSGTDANLVMARDAFARLVETTSKVMDSSSGASARELNEHVRIVNEIVKAKETDDRLSDAEAMMVGAARAQEIMAAESAKETGITNNESAEAKTARLKEYLKDLKECVQ